MDATDRIAIDRQLATLRGPELATVASAALAQCKDLLCQQEVLTAALHQASSLMPQHVGEGGRVALQTGAGALTGLLRGTLGPLWGRVATAGPALVGMAVGLMSKDPSVKAGGYSVLGGTASGEAAIEMYDGGQVLRAKMMAPVSRTQVTAQAA